MQLALHGTKTSCDLRSLTIARPFLRTAASLQVWEFTPGAPFVGTQRVRPPPPSPPCIAERQLPWARQYGGLAAGRMRSRLHAGTQPQPPPITQITHCACHPQVGFALAVSQTGTETKALLTGSFTGALWIDIFETSTVNVGVTVRDATLGCFQAVKPGRCSLLLATAAFP